MEPVKNVNQESICLISQQAILNASSVLLKRSRSVQEVISCIRCLVTGEALLTQTTSCAAESRKRACKYLIPWNFSTRDTLI